MSGARRALGAKLGAASLLLVVFLTQTGATFAPAERAIVPGVPSVKQWYSLSCEYAAAATVTLFWGKLVSQRDFMREIPTHPNPHVGFRGNIHGEWGGIKNYGIYAEPLVPVLESYGYDATVIYGGVGTLKAELAAGHPLVVWLTGTSAPQPASYETHEGETYKLVPYEHAVVAYGYDARGVWIMNVGNGKHVQYTWEDFMRRWNHFDQMALIITPNWD